jgi:hypothetical protein
LRKSNSLFSIHIFQSPEGAGSTGIASGSVDGNGALIVNWSPWTLVRKFWVYYCVGNNDREISHWVDQLISRKPTESQFRLWFGIYVLQLSGPLRLTFKFVYVLYQKYVSLRESIINQAMTVREEITDKVICTHNFLYENQLLKRLLWQRFFFTKYKSTSCSVIFL